MNNKKRNSGHELLKKNSKKNPNNMNFFTFQSFLRPYKISMVNHTFYKYSLYLLYNIHTLLINKVILIFMLKKKYAQITKIDLDSSGQKSKKSHLDSLVLLAFTT
ncbi:hypothetical protein BpHYR1_039178 [Brachionus plicatilis]|uniref:Uncharacterized protein n=1 Tax=Brachionus plicatilis TaxID=10195 RepID=A0A3M7QN15_BRAPC|nr:hypothetical protein BpHYR1_039178 [Brachionus plicatilis]